MITLLETGWIKSTDDLYLKLEIISPVYDELKKQDLLILIPNINLIDVNTLLIF